MSKSKSLFSLSLVVALVLTMLFAAPVSASAAEIHGDPCNAYTGGYAVYEMGETIPACPGVGKYSVQYGDATFASCDLTAIQQIISTTRGTVYFEPNHPDCVAPAQPEPNPDEGGHGGGEVTAQVQSAPSAFGLCPDYSAGVYVTKTWGVRVRQAAGLKSPLVSKTSQLQSKVKVEAVGCTVVDDLVWLEVNTEQFGHGFVAAKFFKPAS